MNSLETRYPFRESARAGIRYLDGLDKLRGIEDREMAGYLAQIWLARTRVNWSKH